LGKIGPTITIAEKDLIEELKERMLKIDWKKKKEQALARYWKRRKYIDLPKAKDNRTFYVSGKFKVKKDFILPDGRVIARKGDVIDQFKYVKPTFCLIIFDASDQKQLEWAINQGEKYKNKYRVKYITTKLPDVEHGWESLGKLYNKLDAPVFFLTGDLKQRFHLKHVPSIVISLQNKFEVKEVCLSNTSDTKN
jgi:conjugal transfer pilus assembly protein TraW